MPSYSRWHTCSTGSSRVHKRQMWAVYSKFTSFTLLSKVLAWCLLPRWPPACLAQREVPRMSSERARRSKWEEHPFVPPPHSPVIIRTIKQTFNWFCIKLPSPPLIPLQPRLCFSLLSVCIHQCMFTSFRTSSSVQFYCISCASIVVPSINSWSTWIPWLTGPTIQSGESYNSMSLSEDEHLSSEDRSRNEDLHILITSNI